MRHDCQPAPRAASGRRTTGPLRRRIAAALAGLAATVGAFALPDDEPAVSRLVAAIEAPASSCAPAREDSAAFRTIRADVQAFRAAVPSAAEVPIDVMDCYWDGMVVEGRRVVISTRLARATPAQRFFMIAHEVGHVRLGHHEAFRRFASAQLAAAGSEAAARQRLQGEALRTLSRGNEAQADAFAVGRMLEAGQPVEEAARFWDQIAATMDTPSAMHPAPAARAAAIRALAAPSAPDDGRAELAAYRGQQQHPVGEDDRR